MLERIFAVGALAASTLLSVDARAQLVDALGATSFDYYPRTANGDIPGETQINVFRASAGAPLTVAKHSTVIAALAYELVDVHPSAGSSFQLHAPKATAGLIQGFGDHWGMMGFVDAGVASDFTENLSSSDVLLSITAIGTYAINEQLKLGAGAVYDRRTGSLAPLPALLLDLRLAPRWRIKGFAPVYVKAEYHAADWLDLGVRATFEGNRFHVGAGSLGHPDLELAYSNLTVGPKVTFNFSDWIHLDVYGAGAVYRRYELFQDDESLARYSLSAVMGYGARLWIAPSGW
jgi:hypothetical protein